MLFLTQLYRAAWKLSAAFFYLFAVFFRRSFRIRRFTLETASSVASGLEWDFTTYVDLHRAELDGKSRALNFGTVGYRVSSKLMLASSRVAEAIATLKVLGHAELIKTTETLDREALKRQPGDILQQVGAYIRTVDEFYYDVSSKEADA